MAEYQNTVFSSGEMAQRFIEFVLMQAQNAAFMLGQIPHPQTGKAEVNVEMARMLIDQLIMIQEKTQGNLNTDESRVLAQAISNLQMIFVEVVQKDRSDLAASEPPPAPAPAAAAKSAGPPPPVAPEPGSSAAEGDGKKKFVKSYGS